MLQLLCWSEGTTVAPRMSQQRYMQVIGSSSKTLCIVKCHKHCRTNTFHTRASVYRHDKWLYKRTGGSPYHADAMHWNVLHGCHNIPEMLQTWCTWYVAASKFKRHLSGTCSILLCPYHVFPSYLSSQFASLFSNSAHLLFRWRSR
jgi:hypothetical protein